MRPEEERAYYNLIEEKYPHLSLLYDGYINSDQYKEDLERFPRFSAADQIKAEEGNILTNNACDMITVEACIDAQIHFILGFQYAMRLIKDCK